MLRISWKEHKHNKEVLNMMKTSLKLMKIIKKRKFEYFKQFIRRPNSIQRLLLEARIDGKKVRGRPRTTWMDNIKDWLNLSYKECTKMQRTERSGDPQHSTCCEQTKPDDDDVHRLSHGHIYTFSI